MNSAASEAAWDVLRGGPKRWLRIDAAADMAEFQAAANCAAWAISLTFFARLYGSHSQMLNITSQEGWVGIFASLFAVITVGHFVGRTVRTACLSLAFLAFVTLFVVTAQNASLPLSTASFAVQAVTLGFGVLVKR